MTKTYRFTLSIEPARLDEYASLIRRITDWTEGRLMLDLIYPGYAEGADYENMIDFMILASKPGVKINCEELH